MMRDLPWVIGEDGKPLRCPDCGARMIYSNVFFSQAEGPERYIECSQCDHAETLSPDRAKKFSSSRKSGLMKPGEMGK